MVTVWKYRFENWSEAKRSTYINDDLKWTWLLTIHALVSITEQMPDAMPEFTIYDFKYDYHVIATLPQLSYCVTIKFHFISWNERKFSAFSSYRCYGSPMTFWGKYSKQYNPVLMQKVSWKRKRRKATLYILGLAVVFRVKIRVRIMLRLLLPNPNSKLRIRVRSKSNSKVRVRVRVRVGAGVRG